MIIIGAKGLAKEFLEILHQNRELKNLCFYDDVNKDIGDTLYSSFRIIKNLNDAEEFIKNVDDRFTIGIGNPKLRKLVSDKFLNLGGKLTSLTSENAELGSYGNTIEDGVNIASGVIITNDVHIKRGTLINLNSTIGHDTVVGEFCEICPSVSISGHCDIGDFVFIGTGATILPSVKIGKNSIIAAGSVVSKDVPENVMVAGVPAVIKKYLNE